VLSFLLQLVHIVFNFVVSVFFLSNKIKDYLNIGNNRFLLAEIILYINSHFPILLIIFHNFTTFSIYSSILSQPFIECQRINVNISLNSIDHEKRFYFKFSVTYISAWEI